MSTSPGCIEDAGKRSSRAFTARGSVKLNTGMARGECASVSPSGLRISQAKSWASEMTSENAVRHTVSHISSTTLTSRLHMISSAIGSASMRAMASCKGVSCVTVTGRAAGVPTAMRRFNVASTSTASSGPTTVVASRSSTMHGPCKCVPGCSASRS